MSVVLYLDTEKVSQKVAIRKLDAQSSCLALMKAVFPAPTKHLTHLSISACEHI